MAGRLLTALSLTDGDGNDVPLMYGDARSVTSASGLAGIAAREVVTARSGRSGSRNLTRWRDDAQIVINGILGSGDADDAWEQYDVVAGAFASAIAADRVLKWTAGTSLELQRNVWLTSLEEPLEVGADILSYQAMLRGSDPNVYSQVLQSTTATPFGSASGGGLVFPVKFPIVFQPPASTTAAFTNGGFLPAPAVFQLSGYLLDPVIQVSPGGQQLVLDGQVAADDVLTIDVAARTITLNDKKNRRYMLDTGKSTWFELPPGTGTITLWATLFSPGAGLTIFWRDVRS